jgi:SAM-dependent methyltransferase
VDTQAGVAPETAVTKKGYRDNARPEVMALLPPLRPGLKVLEIGCGEGNFCTQIDDAAEIWGVEPHLPSAEIAQDRMHTVLSTLFDDAKPKLPLHYFDLVICNDVIEHMTDHDSFLAEIIDYMSDDSLLVGSLPNVRYHENLFDLLVKRDWEYQDWGILDRTHFRFFTFGSARRALERAGFDVLLMRGLNALPVRGTNLGSMARRVFAYGTRLLTLGHASDTKYLQIGFLARPRRLASAPA